MRRHIVLAQIGDEAGHIIGLVGTEGDPVIAQSGRDHLGLAPHLENRRTALASPR